MLKGITEEGKKCSSIELEDRTIIRATKDHKIMTKDYKMLPIDQIFQEGLDLLEVDIYGSSSVSMINF